jgi:two-component system nitrogen regulation sensor histidine kinase NtrY
MLGSSFIVAIKRRFLRVASRPDLTRFLSVFFGICGLFGGLATYVILSGLSPINPSRQIVWFLFGLNIFMVTGLLAVVGWQLVHVWRQARRGEAGAALHGRLVFLFAGIAALPALLVAVFAIVTLDRGLDSWFSDRTKAIISNTTAVANAYLTEHRDLLRRDVTSIARDIGRSIDAMNEDQRRFGVFLTALDPTYGGH